MGDHSNGRLRAHHLWLILIVWLPLHASGAPARLESDWTYVRSKLTKSGFSPTFITLLKSVYEPKHIARVCELNVLLYLRRHDDHGPQANDDGSTKVRAFVTEHAAAFEAAHAKYGVDPLVIASLMYIESRYGRNVGHFHVASVFLDLLQSDRPAVIAHLRAAAPAFRPKITAAIRRDIARRAARKSKWALQELIALRSIYQRDPKILLTLHGSFAGAVGMPQFLPSSYLVYARAAHNGTPPDLTKPEDAILSVANYLHRSGWRQSVHASHERALMKYNQSADYARAIMKLAGDRRPGRRGLSNVVVED